MNTSRKVAVVGAGLMGSGIAQVFAGAGFDVKVIDLSEDLLRSGKDRIVKSLQKAVDRSKDTTLGRLTFSTDISDISECCFCIEVVTENFQVKATVIKEIDEHATDGAIIATNTSTFSITKLASITSRPERFIGMHFFIPAPVMKLIEIIPGLRTDSETVQFTKELSVKIGKEPIIAPDTSGFIVNRLLVPMWNEAMFMVMEGASPRDIDTAVRLGGNLRMGPLELADFAGLDTVLSTMEEMHRYFADPKFRPCPLLKKKVEAGMLGRKSGQGFYDYMDGR